MENDPPSIGRKRWVEIFGGVLHRVCDRARFATLSRDKPELSEQVEGEGASVPRKIEREPGAFTHAYVYSLDGRARWLCACLIALGAYHE